MIRGALLERLPLKAVALFLAFVLWLAVSADEPAEQTVQVRLALRVDSSVVVSGTRDYVSATLTGRRRDLLKIDPDELVLRRTIGSTAADSIRVVLLPSDVELPSTLEGEVRVRDIQPRVLTLRFAHAAERDSASASATPAASRQRVLAARRAPRAVGTEDVRRDSVWRRAADGVLARDSLARDSVRVAPPDTTTTDPPSVLPPPGTPVIPPIVPPAVLPTARPSERRDSVPGTARPDSTAPAPDTGRAPTRRPPADTMAPTGAPRSDP